jgi:hypothetical protein
MTADGELHCAYVEWRRLAEAEGEAIRADNWGFVAECQRALTHLRPIIDRLTNAARQEPASPGSGSLTGQTHYRAIVLELMELERRNLTWLQQRREKLSAQIEQLSRAGRNLRGIQRSYAPLGPSAWTSIC